VRNVTVVHQPTPVGEERFVEREVAVAPGISRSLPSPQNWSSGIDCVGKYEGMGDPRVAESRPSPSEALAIVWHAGTR